MIITNTYLELYIELIQQSQSLEKNGTLRSFISTEKHPPTWSSNIFFLMIPRLTQAHFLLEILLAKKTWSKKLSWRSLVVCLVEAK